MANDSPMIPYLKRYVDAGMIAVPTRSDSKAPIDAWRDVTTKQDAGDLWRKHRTADRCGILTGPSRLIVVDLDVKGDVDGTDSLRLWLQRECGFSSDLAEDEIENCPVSCMTPGGGAHLYYRLPDGVDHPNGSTRGGVLPGVDLRGSGGFVVCPPSMWAGKLYRWTTEWRTEDVPVVPQWLMRLCAWRTKVDEPTVRPAAPLPTDWRMGQASDYHLAEALKRAQLGTRNEEGFQLALQLRDLGMHVDTAEGIMYRYADSVPQGSDRYTPGEALATLRSVFRSTPRDPAVPREALQGATDTTEPRPPQPPPIGVPVERARPDDDADIWEPDQGEPLDNAVLCKLAVLGLHDTGNAQAFAQLHGTDYRYDRLRHQWHKWDAHRWKIVTGSAHDNAMHSSIMARRQAAAVIDDEDQVKALVRHCSSSQNDGKIKSGLARAATFPLLEWASDVELDDDPWILGTPNGVVDLRTGTLRDGRRGDMVTKNTGVPYDPHATAERWELFLSEIFRGDDDLISFIQRAAGYTLTGSTREQALFICHGHGANGKSVFLEALRHAICDYGASTPFSTFEYSRQTDRQTNDLAALRGRRMVMASETQDGRRLDEARVKAVTGDAKVTARFLYSEWFEYTPRYKIWLAANHKPTIRGFDEGIWRRIRLIPFLATFQGNDADPDLDRKLIDEAPGILAWMVRGCVEWVETGLAPPPVVVDATQEYRDESDVIGRFLFERIERVKGDHVRAGVLYSAYRSWCSTNGERNVMTNTKFGKVMKERNIVKSQDSRGRRYDGIRIKVDTSDIPRDDYFEGYD
jgi:putative DNA primase/helicase